MLLWIRCAHCFSIGKSTRWFGGKESKIRRMAEEGKEQANCSRVEQADCRIMEHPNCKESGPIPDVSAFEQQQERTCTQQQWKEQGGPNYPGSVTDGGRRRKKMKPFLSSW